MAALSGMINYIVDRSVQLKNQFTNEKSASIEFACIFCQNKKEYVEITKEIHGLGKIVEKTPTGFTYLLDIPLDTNSGKLRLIKIRKPDPGRKERGDVDFNTNYQRLKEKYTNDPKFEQVKRTTFEMLRLSDPNFDVMVCFSDTPKSKVLGIKL